MSTNAAKHTTITIVLHSLREVGNAPCDHADVVYCHIATEECINFVTTVPITDDCCRCGTEDCMR